MNTEMSYPFLILLILESVRDIQTNELQNDENTIPTFLSTLSFAISMVVIPLFNLSGFKLCIWK